MHLGSVFSLLDLGMGFRAMTLDQFRPHPSNPGSASTHGQQQMLREDCQFPHITSREAQLQYALTLHNALPTLTFQKP